MGDAYDPEKDGAKMSFAQDMSYGDYLRMDAILNAQHPLRKRMMKCCSSYNIRPASFGCDWPSTN